MKDKKVYSVSQVNYYLKQYLAEDELLANIWLRGEISGYKRHSSGHIYFSLKDEVSSLRCVMFRSYASSLKFDPGTGMDVMAYGSISLYERDGNCQLYVREILPAGAGAQALALEELKKKLAGEGIFDQEIKKPLPRFPQRIAVVTSREGAAWADIQKVTYSRWPGMELVLFPTLVQGEKAPQSIAQAICQADQAGCDVMIVGRGGGSYEDLMAFDTEEVVRSIYQSRTPVVSCVGHESDFSLADLAADVRAATPSHAAQLTVPDIGILDQYQKRLKDAYIRSLKHKRDQVNEKARRAPFLRPQALLETRDREVERFYENIQKQTLSNLEKRRQKSAILIAKLDLLSPLATLARGYSVSTDREGKILRSVSRINLGEEIKIRLKDGTLDCEVTGKEA